MYNHLNNPYKLYGSNYIGESRISLQPSNFTLKLKFKTLEKVDPLGHFNLSITGTNNHVFFSTKISDTKKAFHDTASAYSFLSNPTVSRKLLHKV